MKPGTTPIALLTPAIFASACISIGSFQRPEALGARHYQVAAELGALDTTPPSPAPGSAIGFVSGESGVAPSPAVAVRAGINDSIDLGVRASLSGLELGSKFTLFKSQRFVAAVAPSVGGFGWRDKEGAGQPTATGLIVAQLPFIFGFPVGDYEWLVSPKLIDFAVLNSYPILPNNVPLVSTPPTMTTANSLCVGIAFGTPLNISDDFGLIPEISFAYPVFVSQTVAIHDAPSVNSSSSFQYQGVLVNAGAALTFGR